MAERQRAPLSAVSSASIHLKDLLGTSHTEKEQRLYSDVTNADSSAPKVQRACDASQPASSRKRHFSYILSCVCACGSGINVVV